MFINKGIFSKSQNKILKEFIVKYNDNIKRNYKFIYDKLNKYQRKIDGTCF